MKKKKFLIRNGNGTYFRCWTGIGPCFGASREEAERFDTEQEARMETCKHTYAFSDCEIEEI